ncbi:MAG TPA: hypothetical protein DEA55_07525 [Rhodospirillaceae bacterium]|nr:hypothetical protein [Rhodospirillaceae bacterium]
MKYLKRYFVPVTAVLFLLPFSVAAYLLIHDGYEEIKFTQHERVGLRYHQELYNTLITAQRFRGKNFIADVSGIETSDLPAYRDAFLAQVSAVDALHDDAIELALTEEWGAIKNQLLQSIEQIETETPLEHFERQDKATRALLQFMKRVGDNSNLILDPEMETYYMMDVMVNIIPYISNNMAYARGRITAALTKNDVLDNENLETLHQILGMLESWENRYIYSIGIIEGKDPENVSDQIEKKIRAKEQLQKTMGLFYALAGIANETPNNYGQKFFDSATLTIDTFSKVYEELHGRMDLHLTDRIERNTFDLILVLSSLATGFLLSIALMYFAKNMLLQQEKMEKEALKIAKDAAESANAIKSDFLANMSHELRTPLNSIIGMADLILRNEPPPEHVEMLGTMHDASLSLLEIVNDVLDISKIESGNLELENIPFDLHDSMKRVIGLLTPEASKKGLMLNFSAQEKGCFMVMGDPVRYMRIATNLVANAIKYTEAGVVSVLLSSTPVSDTKTRVHLTVRDTGIGIPEEKLGRIFEKFVQADTTTTRKFGGSGLGLTITKELIEMMGGTITAESAVGQGSTFTAIIGFDRATEENIAQSEAEKSTDACATTPISELRVLVAEDHVLNQVFMKKFLPSLGITNFVIIDNGITAKDAALRGDADIVLMDCHMPQMNGYDATRAIRSAEKETGRHVVIIAMTANAMSGERQKCLDCGMDEYITKPVDRAEFIRVLSRWGRFPQQAQNENTLKSDEQIIDMATLRTFSGGDAATEAEFIQVFYDQSLLHLQKLKESCVDGTSEDWKESAHLLKGGTGMIGALKMRDLCAKAQEMLTSTKTERAAILEKINREFDKVCSKLISMKLLPEEEKSYERKK